ncbi:hypothetical protein [Flavobacterium sp.]|uniref:hypothetical protein n=1 Tax=Flavobacterium sp. TaxID=239 RepID=UPI0031D10B98
MTESLGFLNPSLRKVQERYLKLLNSAMKNTLDYYYELLNVYTQEITSFERLKEKTNNEEGLQAAIWSPHTVINSRMFHYDEWLTNPIHNYFCYEQKHKILPKLIEFLASYNMLDDEEKKKFSEIRLRNKYQEYLDEIWKPHTDFIGFLKGQKDERENLKYTFKYPAKPSRSNAYRQLAEFEKKREEYMKDIESQENCIKEIEEWKKLYESVKK